MRVLNGDNRVRSDPPGTLGGDRFLRLHQVLEVHHATSPRRGAVRLLDEPESLDDCMVATTANIQPFRLAPPFRWVNYDEIVETMRGARERSGSHNYPYARDLVFAPLKVVIAETDDPIRAALTYEPCYPWQAKLATRVEGQRLWLVYAAVAVLNSALGRASYRVQLRETPPRSSEPHGLKLFALRQVPIARADWDFEDLTRVADLSYQLTTLYEAAQECLPEIRETEAPVRWRQDLERHYAAQFAQHANSTARRLDDALRQLLGLSEEEEHALLEENRSPESRRSVQPRLFEEWDLLTLPPPPPPLRFVPDEGPLLPGSASALTAPPEGEIRRLLQFWQDAVNSRPPRELSVEARPALARV